MRRLLLILGLVLPSILLPAGVLLQICMCEHSAEMLEGPGCCAPQERKSAPSQSCCCDHAESPDGATSEDAGSSLEATDCRCIWIQLGENQSESAPPKIEPAPSLALQVHEEALRPPAFTDSRARHEIYRSCIRPPPGRQRSLPLLL